MPTPTEQRFRRYLQRLVLALGLGAAVALIVALIKRLMTPAITNEMAPSVRKRTTFAAFVSHAKADASMEARYLQEQLEKKLRKRCFLDSDDLRDLSQLTAHVLDSDGIVVVQSANVLSRPYCLLELYTAITRGVPVVGPSPSLCVAALCGCLLVRCGRGRCADARLQRAGGGWRRTCFVSSFGWACACSRVHLMSLAVGLTELTISRSRCKACCTSACLPTCPPQVRQAIWSDGRLNPGSQQPRCTGFSQEAHLATAPGSPHTMQTARAHNGKRQY